jgi:hypothetical protein
MIVLINNVQTHPLPQATNAWQDSIVQELHAVREQLVAKYQGDMHAYSEACVRHTKALGFTFKTLDSVKESLATP